VKIIKTKAAFLITAGLFGGVIVGTGVTAALAANGSTEVTFSSNSAGQSFGSALNARSVTEEPDLILVEATNGKQGYVKKTDLEPPASIKTPEQAMAYSKQNAAGRMLTVYAEDGKTVVGQFRVGGDPRATPQEAQSK
jgi:predicted outer membrane repeat protein